MLNRNETPILEISEASKTYGTQSGHISALENISLSVDRGEFLAILGPSGCGKSTLLSLAAGLEPLTSGNIELLDKPVKDAVTDVGIVFQTDVLLDWRRVLPNILLQIEMRKLPLSDYQDRALELLKTAGLEGFEEKYPFELSGGMRQRVSICRALIHNPPLLLMDEPFGALDAITREHMGLVLLRIWDEIKPSVLFITHDIAEAVFLSNRVLVMTQRPGRIAKIFDIDLPYPRTADLKETPEFFEYTNKIRECFISEGIL